jgi:two-component system, cell cycle response regulator DivK
MEKTQVNSILYVEDDSPSRRIMKMILVNRMGLSNVSIFEDSENFLERAEALDPKPDLIFLDIHVPPFSGFQMLEMIRQSETLADTIVIALTASVMNEEVEKLRHAGFNGCLSKPIDSDTLPTTIDQIMQGESIWNIII